MKSLQSDSRIIRLYNPQKRAAQSEKESGTTQRSERDQPRHSHHDFQQNREREGGGGEGGGGSCPAKIGSRT